MLLSVPHEIHQTESAETGCLRTGQIWTLPLQGPQVNLFGETRSPDETKQDLSRHVLSPSASSILSPSYTPNCWTVDPLNIPTQRWTLTHHHAPLTLPTPPTCPSSPVEYQGHHLTRVTCSWYTGDSNPRRRTSAKVVLIPEIALVTYPSRWEYITKTRTLYLPSVSRRTIQRRREEMGWQAEADGVGRKVSAPRSGSCSWISKSL